MDYQIQIQYTGKYAIDEFTSVENPLVIAASAMDDFISTVSISCFFNAPTYSYYRNIGSFTYNVTWGNIQVENFINDYMNARKL